MAARLLAHGARTPMAGMSNPRICDRGGKGMFFPWVEEEQEWSDGARTFVYVLGMLYLFLGISTISDKLAAAIEVITSQKKRVRQKSTGRIITVGVWNGTVANVTLVALGSAAPEILVSFVETISTGFHGGELGPGAIVGSAAFNSFVVICLCVSAVPGCDVRRIKELGVFHVATAFMILAFVWIVFICKVITPGVIDIWEAIVTMALLPIFVAVAYLADIGFWFGGRPPPNADREVVLAVEDWDSSADHKDPSADHNGRPAGAGIPLTPSTSRLDVLEHAIGKPANPAGVIGFPSETWEVMGGMKERDISIPVLRRGGCQGTVRCKYRMEARTAVAGYDFVATSGEIVMNTGEDRAYVPVTLMPKGRWEHNDEFQLILEHVRGGATFDPRGDGGEARNAITVVILNEHSDWARYSAPARATRWLDGVMNVDQLRAGLDQWMQDVELSITQVVETEVDGEQPEFSFLDWLFHLISLPWKLSSAIIVPPPCMFNGWLAFVVALAWLAFVTTWLIDAANILGCVTGMGSFVIAFSFLAAGTSVPDLLSAMKRAKHDESADMSILTIIGSNVMKALLGLGLPWFMSSVHWAAFGATGEWKQRNPDFSEKYPKGAFVLRINDDFAFSVGVFIAGAVLAWGLTRLRRFKVGGEVGGPLLKRVATCAGFFLLWVYYIGVTLWKVLSGAESAGIQVFAVFLGICAAENALLVVSGGLLLVQGNADKIKELMGYSDYEELDGSPCIVEADVALKVADAEVPAALPPPPLPPPAVMPGDSPLLRTLQGAEEAAAKELHKAPSRSLPNSAALATTYGLQLSDIIIEPPGAHLPRLPDGVPPYPVSISFTSAAMVCLAAQRFKAAERRFRSSRQPEPPPWGTTSSQMMMRENSFHSVVEEASPPAAPARPAPTTAVGTMGGRVAGYVGRHAADLVALSAAGLAAVQFADQPCPGAGLLGP